MVRHIKSKTVKTRADHRCFGCGDVIPKGSIAHVDCNVEGNQIYSLYLHPECKAILDDILQIGRASCRERVFRTV